MRYVPSSSYCWRDCRLAVGYKFGGGWISSRLRPLCCYSRAGGSSYWPGSQKSFNCRAILQVCHQIVSCFLEIPALWARISNQTAWLPTGPPAPTLSIDLDQETRASNSPGNPYRLPSNVTAESRASMLEATLFQIMLKQRATVYLSPCVSGPLSKVKSSNQP